ncbi:hypothetical protein HispidOSU_022182, partial [Sigmodon hispidus]
IVKQWKRQDFEEVNKITGAKGLSGRILNNEDEEGAKSKTRRFRWIDFIKKS